MASSTSALARSTETSAVEGEWDVEMRASPQRARAHPPQTEDLTRSPAKAEMRGVMTTLVWVRKDARAAGLKRSPALMRPYDDNDDNDNNDCRHANENDRNRKWITFSAHIKTKLHTLTKQTTWNPINVISSSPVLQNSKTPTPKRPTTWAVSSSPLVPFHRLSFPRHHIEWQQHRIPNPFPRPPSNRLRRRHPHFGSARSTKWEETSTRSNTAEPNSTRSPRAVPPRRISL